MGGAVLRFPLLVVAQVFELLVSRLKLCSTYVSFHLSTLAVAIFITRSKISAYVQNREITIYLPDQHCHVHCPDL